MQYLAIYQLLAVALLTAASPTEETGECTLYRLQRCLQSLQSVTQGSDLAMAANHSELISVCISIKASVLCVDEHMENCFSLTQRKVFNQVVAGARQFLNELCVAGSTQDAYLQHSSCYRNVTLSEEKCAPEYRQLIRLSEKVNERVNVDEGLKESCCAFNSFVLCKHIHVSRDCGQAAAHFLQQHLDKISSPLINEHCEHYTHMQNACQSSGAHTSYISFIIISLISIEYVMLKSICHPAININM